MDWHNGWEMVAALTTAGLFVMASYQVREVRKENRVERTLAACSRYESDGTIEKSVERLRCARAEGGDYEARPVKYQHQAIMILNFLDTIAIGVRQGVYDEGLARDHMEAIVRKWIVLLEPEAARKLDICGRDYHCLTELWARWQQGEMYYGTGLFRRLRAT